MQFRTKILLVFTAFALMLAALMSGFNLQSKKLLEKEAGDNQRSIARVIHLSAQRLLSENVNDKQVLKRIVEEIKRIEAINEVTIIDKNQIVVASTNLHLVGQHQPLSSMELEINKRPGDKGETEEYSSFEIGVPVMRKQRMVGLVRTTMTLKDVRRPLRILYLKNVVIIFCILIIGFWVSFFWLSRLNRPLRQLTAAVEKISAGDLTVTVPCTTKDEIGRLAESFNRATQKLAEQKKLESRVHQLERRAIVAELSSCLAHEIRNPLNLIMLTASHLGNQFSPEDQAKQKEFKEYIGSLKSEVKQLNRMVGSFLAMGKPSTVKKRKLPLSEVVDRIRTLVKQQLLTKDISLEISGETDLVLFADEEQMQLVFLNLTLNAIDAAPLHGKIEIQGSKITGSRELLVSVIDNGTGIKPENLDKIFEPYFSKRPDGIGLGLAVVKRIVEEHGGRINARNTKSGGTEFNIALPPEEN